MNLLTFRGKQLIRSAIRFKTGLFRPYFRAPGGRVQFNTQEPRYFR